jgi:hypothetical protein
MARPPSLRLSLGAGLQISSTLIGYGPNGSKLSFPPVNFSLRSSFSQKLTCPSCWTGRRNPYARSRVETFMFLSTPQPPPFLVDYDITFRFPFAFL